MAKLSTLWTAGRVRRENELMGLGKEFEKDEKERLRELIYS